ncbi:hypothetical protein BB561_000885 [Smittium simulii]|uniref:Ribosome assembly protein 1 n=1 Tax=Smittium simulii TaxID=133385 RepID=A0A2T9YX77_9FUNG|nr:hypothetical protein BB561_000885 [Smittium simulii]
MSTVPITKLAELQKFTQNIRNVCVLAHVDHGKTTLTDSLLSTNGIISSRLAGKVRYLDSRQDEQERGITMESSGVSLYFKVINKPTTQLPLENTESAQPHIVEPSLQVSEYLINLIDSPGHIDFSSEVSSASRLTDGALVLVDAIEGVCTQTISVLRQAWLEKVQTILVINKIDRLIIELLMTPAEAYTHMQQLIEQVNAVLAGFWESDRIAASDKKSQKLNPTTAIPNSASGYTQTFENMSISTKDWHLDEIDDSNIYFDPSKGNVIFSSATDGWAFRVNDFATFASEKMGLGNPDKLKQFIWGDYYFDPKNKKRVLGKKQFNKLYRSENSKAYPNIQPLFVQLCLSSIWKVYEATVLNSDQDRIDKIISSLGCKITTRDRKVKDQKILASLIMRSWLPLAQTCMLAIIDQLPSPNQAQSIRIPKLIKGKYNFHDGPVVTSLLDCDANSSAVAYVSKILSMKKSNIPEFSTKSDRLNLTADEMRARGRTVQIKPNLKNDTFNNIGGADSTAQDLSINKQSQDTFSTNKQSQDTSPTKSESQDTSATKSESQDTSATDCSDEALIGFARLYCGVLKKGDEVFCMSPRYKPKKNETSTNKTARILGLYIFMGNELLAVDKVYPGCIFGIRGLDNVLSSSGTITTDITNCPNLGSLHFESAPIVRVAVEPVDPTHINKLVSGLKILCDSDSCVRVDHTSSGEYVLVTAGELHLERCLKDLIERFAKCEINVSEPRVPFKETIVRAPGRSIAMTMLNGPNATSTSSQLRSTQRNTDTNDEDLDLSNAINKAISDGLVPASVADERGFIAAFTPNKFATVYLGVQPMNKSAVSYLTSNKSRISNFSSKLKFSNKSKNADHSNDNTNSSNEEKNLKTHAENLVENGYDSTSATSNISPEKHIDLTAGKDGSELLENNNTNDIDSSQDSYDSSTYDASEDSDIEYEQSSSLNFKVKENRNTENLVKSSDDRLNESHKSKKESNTHHDIIFNKVKSLLMKDKAWEKRSEELNSSKIWCFGPYHNGANILFYKNDANVKILEEKINIFDAMSYNFSEQLLEHADESRSTKSSSSAESIYNLDKNFKNSDINISIDALIKDIIQSVDSAFQLAMKSGPLCLEPTVGLACTIYHIDININKEQDPSTLKSILSTLYGQLISTVRDAIREAMLMWSPRLLLATYGCEIQASSDILGKMYGVISKRKGKIISEELLEGTPYFKIKATLPVVESFGFTDEMRKRTSGGAQPVLVFKGFEILDIDPFWVPTTEEELEDLGEKADHDNVARAYMDAVRKSKGLFVERKIVEHAEKQRTLKR